MSQRIRPQTPHRRVSLGVLAAAIGFLGAVCAADAQTANDADAVHRAVLVLDSHVDVLLPSTPRHSYEPDGSSYADLDKLTRGGIDAVTLCAAVGDGPRTPEGVVQARAEIYQKLAWIHAFVDQNPARIGLALSADDVERLHGQGKIAVIISFQNARALGTDVSQIDVLYRAGVRVFSFNHAGNNAFSDSSRPAREPYAENGGLSELGRQGVRRLNDLGVLIDVSQLSTQAVLQTVALSRAPVAATHSDVRALVDNPRNLSDAEIDAIAAKGGVIQVTPFSVYLHNPSPARLAQIAAVRQQFGMPVTAPTDRAYAELAALPEARRDAYSAAIAALPPERATIADFVDHIDYLVHRVGIEHVGIGSDFNHGAGIDGFANESEAENVTRELLHRGYTQPQIAAIWGGNFLRVWRAAAAQAEHSS